MIKKISEKIKLSKEGWRDILYIVATVIIIAIITGFFIWSMRIIIKAINTAFFGINQDISSEILSFDLIGFNKIAPRLNINFSLFSETTPSSITEESVPIVEQQKEIIVDISKISLKILNGTTISGLAGSWKTKFIEAGFIKENISTGNANKRDYSGITITNNSSDAIIKKVVEVFGQSNISIKLEKDDNLNENAFTIIIGK